MKESLMTQEALRKELDAFFRDVVVMALRKPPLFARALRIFFAQAAAARRRARLGRRGILVPPIMILSMTGRCNLHCTGCYAREFHGAGREEMDEATIESIVKQASDLGISVVLLAGGEPFVRRDELLRLAANNPSLLFLIFTNGLMITAQIAGMLTQYRNIVPVVSLEGDSAQTDTRRGSGVYDSLMKTAETLVRASVFYGMSITVTTDNVDSITDDSYIDRMRGKGCGLFFFIEYVPVRKGTEHLVLTPEQRQRFLRNINLLRRKKEALFVAFPGDEAKYGGCLAAGRGLIHVNSHGGVEPCPFSPYSDVSLKKRMLADALDSVMLQKIRDNHDLLGETSGGCALWRNRDLVKSLLSRTTEEHQSANRPLWS